MNNNLKPVTTLSPFKRFCITIGELPTSYLETMTYYEMLLWFTKYLDETVIPAIDNNGEALKELQDYVVHYFDNLDVQEEINNKLDEMVQDGTFEQLIDDYTTIPELTNRVTNLEIQNNGKYIFIGDSYIAQLGNDSWAHKLSSKLGLNNGDYYIFGEGGSGFNKEGNQGHTFKTLLQNNISLINDRTQISHIIVGGGYNDQESTSQQALEITIQSFIAYCKEQFINANVYIGEFGWTMKHSYVNARYNINNIVIPAYKNCHNYGGIYLSNVELCFRNKDLYDSGENEVHPNTTGSDKIASALYDALHNGYVVETRYDDYLIPTSDTFTTSNLHLYDKLNNGFHSLELNGSLTCAITHSGTSGFDLDLGVFGGKFMRRTTNNILSFGTINLRLGDTLGNNYWVVGNITINNNGHLVITIHGSQLPSTELTIQQILAWCTFNANGYLW